MNAKTWTIFAVVVVVILGALVFFSGQNRIDVSNVNENTLLEGTEASGNIGDHTKGNATASVSIIEYGDYQCPGCGAVHPHTNELVQQYGEDISLTFRHLPLTSMHPNARAAATAAEAAGKQSKYWEMHDLLFDNQNTWSGSNATERTQIFQGYAQQLGLNMDQFNTDLASPEVSAKINFDLALAKKIGANATPTFFVNGERIDNGQNIDDLSANLDEAVRAAIVANGGTVSDDTNE